MVSLLAGLVLMGQAPGDRRIASYEITRNPAKGASAMVRIEMDQLEESKKSPKKFGTPPVPWEFTWLVQGYVRVPNTPQYRARFRVYSQERKEKDDPAPNVARMLTALWEENADRLRYDHPEQYNGGLVDVYLCWGGKAGGEQRFGVDFEAGIQKSVNTIYFYDLSSFTDPVEKAREVAHEYGHAIFPAVGGYEAPEDWANGYLGEKLFLRWLRDGMTEGRLKPEDAMGAEAPQLDEWVKKNVDPLVVTASQNLPTAQYLADRSAAGMDRYTGLALYIATVFPERLFSRSMLLIGSTDAKDYPAAIMLAADEGIEYSLNIPAYLKGKSLWIPLNKAKVKGAKILRTVGKWAKIQPTASEVVILNPENKG